jgi:hypothetical protein
VFPERDVSPGVYRRMQAYCAIMLSCWERLYVRYFVKFITAFRLFVLALFVQVVRAVIRWVERPGSEVYRSSGSNVDVQN